MKKRFVLWGALVASAAFILIGAPAANATGDHTEPETTEVYWSMPDGGTPENVTWPQTHSPEGAVECGVWYQVDRYEVDEVDALTADGILTNGEDHGIAISWRFEQGPVCPPEPVTVTPLSPTFEDDCELAVTVNIPEDTDQYSYTALVNADGYAKVTATAFEGFVFDDGYATRVWEHQSTNDEPCEPVTPPVEPPAVVTPPVEDVPVVPTTKLETLPETGAGDVVVGILAALASLAVIATGVLALLWDRKRRTESETSNS